VLRARGRDRALLVQNGRVLLDARALLGYATTDSGPQVVFSILVNGDAATIGASRTAIDAVVNAMLRIAS